MRDVDFLKFFAKTAVKLKNNKKAVKLYKAALKINNNDFEACLGTGECYLNLDNFEGAGKYLGYAKTLESNSENKANLFFA